MGSLGDDKTDARVEEHARELLEGGVAATERYNDEILIQTFHPARRLLVVGEGELATAICRQAGLLEWEAVTSGDRRAAVQQLQQLGPSDALVVPSHAVDVDVPVLAAALRSPTGYVGALGSHGTQSRRAKQLRESGTSEQEIASIYGPIGLDIRASTPAETAVAICCEILSVAAGRSPIFLRDSSKPIHAGTEAASA